MASNIAASRRYRHDWLVIPNTSKRRRSTLGDIVDHTLLPIWYVYCSQRWANKLHRSGKRRARVSEYFNLRLDGYGDVLNILDAKGGVGQTKTSGVVYSSLFYAHIHVLHITSGKYSTLLVCPQTLIHHDQVILRLVSSSSNMFSSFIPSSLPHFGFGRAKTAQAITIPSVEVHDIEVLSDKRGRRLKHLIKLNHATYSILYHSLRFHNHTPHVLETPFSVVPSVPDMV